MTWHIGAFTGNCHQRPIVELIRTLADAGVLGIEIPTPAQACALDTCHRAEIEAVKVALRTTGMRAVAIHASFGSLLDLADPDPHRRNAGIDAVMAAAAVLEALHGRLVITQATRSPRAVPDRAERLQHACASVRFLQSAFAGLGMTLAIETPPRHLIGGAPEEFARLLATAGPETRVCLDVGKIAPDDWDAFADLAAGRVAHVHAPDTTRTLDDAVASANSHIYWSRIARTLDRTKYDAWLMLELGAASAPLAQDFHRSAEHLRDRLDAARIKPRPLTSVDPLCA